MKKDPATPIQSAVADALTARAVRIEKEAREQVDTVRSTKTMLDAAHDDFMQTGIAFIPERLQTYLNHWIEQGADSYFRTVARETGRLPLIAMAQRNYVRSLNQHVESVFLTMPKQKRLKNVMAGMLLVSQECTNDAAALAVSPVGRHDSKGLWRLYFNGDQGRDIFDEFRERCSTDPVMRCVLRL